MLTQLQDAFVCDSASRRIDIRRLSSEAAIKQTSEPWRTPGETRLGKGHTPPRAGCPSCERVSCSWREILYIEIDTIVLREYDCSFVWGASDGIPC